MAPRVPRLLRPVLRTASKSTDRVNKRGSSTNGIRMLVGTQLVDALQDRTDEIVQLKRGWVAESWLVSGKPDPCMYKAT